MSEPDSTVDAPRVRRPAGAARKRRVVGRGSASGHGGTSGRGTKGQRARAGSGVTIRGGTGSRPLPAFPQDEINRIGSARTATDPGLPVPPGATEGS